MYTIVPSKRFRHQLKKLARANPSLLERLEVIIETLRLGQILSKRHLDHALTGRLRDFRECHVTPDRLLIYRKEKATLILELFSTGTHASLFRD